LISGFILLAYWALAGSSGPAGHHKFSFQAKRPPRNPVVAT